MIGYVRSVATPPSGDLSYIYGRKEPDMVVTTLYKTQGTYRKIFYIMNKIEYNSKENFIAHCDMTNSFNVNSQGICPSPY